MATNSITPTEQALNKAEDYLTANAPGAKYKKIIEKAFTLAALRAADLTPEGARGMARLIADIEKLTAG